jgi:hypothetical protein
MRTTVTLDPDVAEYVKSLARTRSVSFKVALNDSVREGAASRRGGRRPFKVESRALGVKVDLTHALQLVGDLEDEEIIRKMQLRK